MARFLWVLILSPWITLLAWAVMVDAEHVPAVEEDLRLEIPPAWGCEGLWNEEQERCITWGELFDIADRFVELEQRFAEHESLERGMR